MKLIIIKKITIKQNKIYKVKKWKLKTIRNKIKQINKIIMKIMIIKYKINKN